MHTREVAHLLLQCLLTLSCREAISAVLLHPTTITAQGRRMPDPIERLLCSGSPTVMRGGGKFPECRTGGVGARMATRWLTSCRSELGEQYLVHLPSLVLVWLQNGSHKMCWCKGLGAGGGGRTHCSLPQGGPLGWVHNCSRDMQVLAPVNL